MFIIPKMSVSQQQHKPEVMFCIRTNEMYLKMLFGHKGSFWSNQVRAPAEPFNTKSVDY